MFPTPFQPKIVVIRRRQNQGFGFTLRHFIAYPPETCSDLSNAYQRKAMETIFIKEVQPNGPAFLAGLQMGDRVLMVNNIPVAGIPYGGIVTMIKQTPTVLRLQVVPKECDILQMYYTDIAHIPESNRHLDTAKSLVTHNVHSNKNIIAKKDINVGLSTTNYNLSGQNEASVGTVQANKGLLVRRKPPELTVLSYPNNEADFMIRIRKSIEQKEEFLKSPSYNTPSTSLFPVTKNSFKPLPKAPIKNDLNFYGRDSIVTFSDRTESSERNSLPSHSNNNYQKDLLYLDTFPDTGVTNKVFERKQAHLKDMEHFLPLSTAGVEEKSIYRNEVMKKALEYEKQIGNKLKTSTDAQQEGDFMLKQSLLPIGKVDVQQKTQDVLEIPVSPSVQKSTDVVRRYKSIVFDNKRFTRRISYLKATNNDDECQLEYTNEFNTIEEKQSLPEECQSANVDSLPDLNGKQDEEVKIDESFESELEIKSAYICGKRFSDYRSWHQTKVELKGDILKIYAGRNAKTDSNVIEINVKNYNVVDVKEEKKKFVFRLQFKSQLTEIDTSECNEKLCEYKEISFKTKTLDELKKWISLLQEKARDIDLQLDDAQGRQLAEPQKTAATSSVPTSTYCDDSIQDYPSLDCSTTKCEGEPESPVFQASAIKTRKARRPLVEKDLGSSKTKNWKDLLFRRIHSTNTDVCTANLSSTRPSASIGVPLKSCPMSEDNEFVPHIVDVCTQIVESRGLSVVGIYRIPGNKAAISELKDQVNRSDFTWDKVGTDVRWEDVNVVSSLLKLFIRSLPDALLPSTFYNHFIEADKKIGDKRLKELKHLMKSLPVHSYETMKHIIRHLHRVSKNCDVNLMEPKNLAIIFGPSIIRTPNDTLEIAVKDMKHQCRIVELLVSQYEYFFENGSLPDLKQSSHIISSPSQSDQTSLLLDNVSKIEHRFHDKESMASRFIPTLKRRAHSKRATVSSETYSGESVLSLEYKKSPGQVSKETLEHVKCDRSSLEISILLDKESSNSRLSESGSMSLTTITDTLDSKLRSLRSGSESVDENDSPNNQGISRRNFPQTLALHENIPYADESPERHVLPEEPINLKNKNACTLNVGATSTRDVSKATLNSRFISVYESCSDDSEVSTTSDPKESLLISPLFLERYKKRRDYRLFRSASFNCRNYSTRHNNSNLTKDEKTDMNITKKRQIQNKQNRSIKRRHTVGGPHDYSTTITRRTNNDHVLEVGIRIKNVNRRN